MVYYFDMDGVLSNFHKEPYNYENAINRDWIANLEPWTYNVRLVNMLIEEGHKVYILTKAASEDARDGKVDWLNKYIPSLDMNNFICLIKNGKKVDYIQEDGVLIDDDKRNTIPWEKAGHKALLLEYKGQRVRL